QILILAYMRTGSTFVGELLKRGAKEIHYTFEPFWGVYGRAFRNKKDVCHRNDTCLAPDGELQSTEKMFEILRHILNCKLSLLPYEVLKGFITFEFSTGYSKKCLVAFSEKFMLRGSNESTKRRKSCVEYWEQLCRNSDAQIIKSIRLSTDFADDVIRAFPRLKIVHLVRDPRAIINSRIKIKEIDIQKEDKRSYFKNLCNSMYHDIRTVMRMTGRRKNIIQLSFEELTKNTMRGAKRFLKRVGLNYTMETEYWLKKYSVQNGKTRRKHKESYVVKKTDSKEIAHAWKSQLSSELIGEINSECGHLINLMKKSEYGRL
ncbi:hypothetical protein FSP39_007264, partial [Pinctada imbricata]